MERIALIIPPSVFLADERVFPSLGILKIAACLEKADYPVSVLDLSGIANYEDAMIDFCCVTDANIFGLSCTSPQMPSVEKLVKLIREMRPGMRIILGGAHITATCSEYRDNQKTGMPSRVKRAFQRISDLGDILVSGDAEISIFQAISADAPHIIDGDHLDSPFFLQRGTLDQFPFPSRHLIDMESYHFYINGVRATSLIGMLGCPYQCTFCGLRLSPSFRVTRTRSTDNILAEIKHLHGTYGFRGFMFSDDESNLPGNFVELMNGLADLQEELCVAFVIRGFVKANLFSEQQAQAMKRAGFKNLLVGFESGSEQILTNIRKKSTKNQNTQCMEIAHKYGFNIKALMSIGHAGETDKTIAETHDWLLNVEPQDFDCTVICVYPGTPYHSHSVPHPTKKDVWVYTASTGDKLYSYETDFLADTSYYKGVPGEYKSHVFTDALKPEDIVELRDWIENDVRQKLHIPYCKITPATRFEHTMGMFGSELPARILKSAG